MCQRSRRGVNQVLDGGNTRSPQLAAVLDERTDCADGPSTLLAGTDGAVKALDLGTITTEAPVPVQVAGGGSV